MPPYLPTLTRLFLFCLLFFHARPTNAQVIVTVAGTGAAGYTGDGGAATGYQPLRLRWKALPAWPLIKQGIS